MTGARSCAPATFSLSSVVSASFVFTEVGQAPTRPHADRSSWPPAHHYPSPFYAFDTALHPLDYGHAYRRPGAHDKAAKPLSLKASRVWRARNAGDNVAPDCAHPLCRTTQQAAHL